LSNEKRNFELYPEISNPLHQDSSSTPEHTVAEVKVLQSLKKTKLNASIWRSEELPDSIRRL